MSSSSAPHHPTRPPTGLWASLAHAADAPTVGAGDLWRGLSRRLLAAPPAQPGAFWPALAARTDPAQYRPRAVPSVPEERMREGEQVLTVIRSPRGNYLHLTEPQREIWHQMDGTRTVAQIATGAFLKFKQLLPVGDLATTLRDEGFLTDQPVGLYRALAGSLEARTAEGWGRRVLRALSGATWRIERIDALYAALYRAGGWALFTPAFLVIWAVLALAGLGTFVALLLGFGHPLPLLGSAGISFELVALWCALLVSFVLHESAHALTVKHYGRELRSGGLMLYFGMPACFVDTSDIWRSPRPARMLVSAAGPMADLLIGGLAALLALRLPVDSALASAAYKLACTCYIATLFNLNPLLELDGYYILVDWLRLPDLRRRALAFMRGPFWKKLERRRTKDQEPNNDPAFRFSSFVLRPFSHEERIFTLYGALTLLYSLVAIVFALQFWRSKLLGAIVGLWRSDSPLGWAVALALALLVIAPLLAGLALAGLGIGRAGLTALLRRGYGRQPGLLAALGGSLAILLAWLVWRLAGPAGPASRTWLALATPALAWALALGALLGVLPDYRRAAIGTTLRALLVAAGLALAAALARGLGMLPDANLALGGAALALDGLAMLFLMVAGFAALLDVDLRLSTPRELAATALLLMLAFGAGAGALLIAPDTNGTLARIAAAAPAYFGAVALALLLPHLFDLADSRLVWSWALLWCAGLAQTAAYVAELGARASPLGLLAAGLWAAAWLVHLATLRQIAPDEIAWPHEPSISEQQRLTRAFQFCYGGCYRLLRAVYGARRTGALDDRMDVLAATANWDVTLDRDRVRISPLVQSLPLDLQGARYAEVLRYTVASIEAIAGATFARRAIQAAYDALPWPERETASRYCFPDTPWARELSSAFGDVRAARLRLLRQVDQLLACDDDELAALAHAIEEQHLPAGALLLRAGEQPAGVWVIEAGEVLASQAGRAPAELHRGDAIGAEGLAGEQPSLASYQATIACELLFIPAAEYRALIPQAAAQTRAAADTVARLKLLERVPMFADLPRNTLRGLANVAQRREFATRSVVVRQGVPSGVFYIIQAGRAAVFARSDAAPGDTGKLHPIAQLGPEEFFGELELLRGSPPVASVVAATPLTVLALPHAAVHAFIVGDGRIASGLEQVGTGRLIALRGTLE